MVESRRTVHQQSRQLLVRRHRGGTRRARFRSCLYGGIMSLAIFAVIHLHISQMSSFAMMADERRVAEQKQRQQQLKPPLVLSFMSNKTDGSSSYAHDLQATIIVSDSTMAAACTQSLVEQQIAPELEVHVITIEFVHFELSHAILAKRLRQRYPNAVILFIGVWNAEQIFLSSPQSRSTATSMRQWQLENKHESIHSLDFTMSMFHAGPEKWSFIDAEDQQHYLQDAMKQTGAYLMRLPTPDAISFQFPLTLREHFSLLTADGMQLSETGHHVIAQNIQHFLSHTAPAAIQQQQQQQQQKQVKFDRKNWGSGDQCHVWYSTGVYGPYYNSAMAVQFASRSKFALQTTAAASMTTTTSSTTEASTLQIRNPFAEPRMLYLTYMSSTSEESYSPTRILLDQTAMVMIDPFHQRDVNDDDYFAEVQGETIEHVVRTSPIGIVPPGIHELRLLPSTKVPSKFGFRLVGISFLAEEVTVKNHNDDGGGGGDGRGGDASEQLVPIEFALERDAIFEGEETEDLATRLLETIWPS